MAFFASEFPRTRNYDDDLRELIWLYKELVSKYKDLVNIYQDINENLAAIAKEELQKLIESGEITIDVTYEADTDTLSFIFANGGA